MSDAVVAAPLPLRALERRSAWLALVSQLLIATLGHAELVSHQETPWASLTFEGARHAVVLRFAGEDAIAFGHALAELLPTMAFVLPRATVADAEVLATETSNEPSLTLTLGILVVDA